MSLDRVSLNPLALELQISWRSYLSTPLLSSLSGYHVLVIGSFLLRHYALLLLMCLEAFRRCRARARRLFKEAQRASWKAYVSSINAHTPLTDVFSKVRELLGSILLFPHQFCCLLGERGQTLGPSPTSSRSTFLVFPGVFPEGDVQPRAHVTAREWNLLS
ncbi:hypothetical protein E2C01_060681 [Portunus trituberculatus]|uniref:Uncharacterized protein n=1 Tax=Portunus trituberculatus TaxID=210409 RepID=A0A5B7H662_PORTR|nr:hypothetical protein [Portunus trituberculatus]